MQAIVLIASVFLTAASFSHEARTASEAKFEFNIPQQSLADALAAWSKQSGLQVLRRDNDSAADLETRGVSGKLSPSEALERMLTATGLTYEFVNDRTVRVAPARTNAQTTSYSAEGAHNTGMTLTQNTGNTGESSDEQSNKQGPEGSKDSSSDTSKESLQEIIVTGSLVRRTQNEAVPIIVFDNDAIERTGQATVSRVLRTLPQNFRANTELQDIDPSGSNLGGGSGVNLRGLGLDSTLVLVNGHRLARGGAGGTFFDLDSIPAAAVERIEILTDGASATYGADAIGGVVNVIMRSDYDGADLRLRHGVADGSYSESDVGFAVGRDWRSGSAFFAFSYNDQDGLLQRDRDFTSGNNFSSQGGSNFQVSFGAPGNIRAVDGFLNASGVSTPAGVFIPIPELSAGQTLTPGMVIAAPQRFTDTAGEVSLVPEQERTSAYASFRQGLFRDLEAYGSVIAARREYQSLGRYPTQQVTVPAANPFNSFGEAVQVRYAFSQEAPIATSDTESYGITLGLNQDFDVWHVDLSTTHGRELITQNAIGTTIRAAAVNTLANSTNPQTALNLFGSADDVTPEQLSLIQNINIAKSDNREWNVRLVVDGALDFGLSRPVRAAFGAEYRDTSIEFNQRVENQGVPFFTNAQIGSESNSALFGEVLLPLLSNQPFARALDLTVAGRIEETSSDTVAVPEISLLWSPIPDLALRLSWGESYKSPLLRDRFAPSFPTPFTLSLVDPKTGAASTPNVTLISGGNSGLQPETAETLAADFNYRPSSVPGLSVGLEYFKIKFDNRVMEPGLSFALQNEDFIPGLVTRGPAPPGGFGPIIELDLRARNLAEVNTSGIDLHSSMVRELWGGSINFGANITYITEYETLVFSGSPAIDVLGTVGFPPEVRGTLYAGFSIGPWSTNVNYNYTDSYREGTLKIDSHSTVDLRASYDFADSRDRRGSTFTIGANNLFDEVPPFRNALSGYDPAVADPRGRVIYAEFSISW